MLPNTKVNAANVIIGRWAIGRVEPPADEGRPAR